MDFAPLPEMGVYIFSKKVIPPFMKIIFQCYFFFARLGKTKLFYEENKQIFGYKILKKNINLPFDDDFSFFLFFQIIQNHF